MYPLPFGLTSVVLMVCQCFSFQNPETRGSWFHSELIEMQFWPYHPLVHPWKHLLRNTDIFHEPTVTWLTPACFSGLFYSSVLTNLRMVCYNSSQVVFTTDKLPLITQFFHLGVSFLPFFIYVIPTRPLSLSFSTYLHPQETFSGRHQTPHWAQELCVCARRAQLVCLLLKWSICVCLSPSRQQVVLT